MVLFDRPANAQYAVPGAACHREFDAGSWCPHLWERWVLSGHGRHPVPVQRPGSHAAHTLPTGSIHIIVGFPPGGSTNALARVMAQKLTKMCNTPIVIEKQPRPDTELATQVSYAVERDFYPIALQGACHAECARKAGPVWR